MAEEKKEPEAEEDVKLLAKMFREAREKVKPEEETGEKAPA